MPVYRLPLNPSLRRGIPGALPGKANRVPAPRPGVPVPKIASTVAKIATAVATGTLPNRVTGYTGQSAIGVPAQPQRRTAGMQRPITPGAMPRKVFMNPKAAVPMRARAPGANAVNPTVFDRLTRGRILQRGTR